MKIGDVFEIEMHGRLENVKLLAIHPLGTMDVERLSDGKTFRLTGLPVYRTNSNREEMK